MINRETAKQFLEVNGYPNSDSNFENELIDTMVEYALQQVKNNDSLHSVSNSVCECCNENESKVQANICHSCYEYKLNTNDC